MYPLYRIKASYEAKLATITAINSALQAENDKLKQKLDAAQTPSTAAEADIEELKEELSVRLAAADRKIHAAQNVRDSMRAQLRAASQGGSVSEAKLKEKDDYIRALNAEGEKLSKKNGELEATARRLRAQLRDVEAERDRVVAQISKAEATASAAVERVQHLETELATVQEKCELKVESARQKAESELVAVSTADAGREQPSADCCPRQRGHTQRHLGRASCCDG